MYRLLTALAALAFLGACEITPSGPSAPSPTRQPAPTQPQPGPAEKSTIQRSASAGIANYRRVVSRVEPVAERACNNIHRNKPATFCDFRIEVVNDPRQPPNAFQSIGRDGRPILAFNINMLRTVKNDDEIAFILGHEAGHQIARHIEQKVQNSQVGAILGALVIGATGGNAEAAAELGGFIGGRAYSKKFELEADRIGAHIASRSGYDPARGALSFNRTVGSNALLATHPPGADRLNTVRDTVTIINAARARGTTAPIRW